MYLNLRCFQKKQSYSTWAEADRKLLYISSFRMSHCPVFSSRSDIPYNYLLIKQIIPAVKLSFWKFSSLNGRWKFFQSFYRTNCKAFSAAGCMGKFDCVCSSVKENLVGSRNVSASCGTYMKLICLRPLMKGIGNDFRLVFEIKFVAQLFEDYKPIKLMIWRTFTDTNLRAILAM